MTTDRSTHCLFTAFILSCMASVFSALAPATALEDMAWIEVRSANFHLLSVLPEKEAVELTRDLELFHAAVSRVANISADTRPIPTVVYAIGNAIDFRQFGVEENQTGAFQRGLRSNAILIRDKNSLYEQSTILHEYTHFLVSNQTNLLFPKWFNEGFAEHLSDMRMRRNMFEIGLPSKHKRAGIRNSRWIPIADILAGAEYFSAWSADEQAMFYAESWALVHYLLQRPGRETPFAVDMQRYLALIESGEEYVAAFEEAFDESTEALDRDVQRHLRKGALDAFSFKVDELLPVFEADVVLLSRQETALGLAQIALRNGAIAHAKHWFEIALGSVATRPRAEAGLGDIFKFRADFAAAKLHFAQAIALAPDDPYCRLDFAQYWHYRAIHANNAEQRKQFFSQAREHYKKAQQLDDTMPETYAMYGQTYLMQNKPRTAIKMLEKAEHRLPSALDIRLILAEAYASANRREDAAGAARSVLIWAHEEQALIERANDVLAEVSP